MAALRGSLSTIRLVWADGGYPGRLIIWAKDVLAPYDADHQTHPLGVYRFPRAARIWVVERSFAWINKHRRCVRDYETRPDHHKAMVHLAMITTITRALPCPGLGSKHPSSTYAGKPTGHCQPGVEPGLRFVPCASPAGGRLFTLPLQFLGSGSATGIHGVCRRRQRVRFLPSPPGRDSRVTSAFAGVRFGSAAWLVSADRAPAARP